MEEWLQQGQEQLQESDMQRWRQQQKQQQQRPLGMQQQEQQQLRQSILLGCLSCIRSQPCPARVMPCPAAMPSTMLA
jgi:hypothetical protein